MRALTLLRMLRAGDMRTRLGAVRDGQAAVRVSAVGAGLRTGVLEALRERPATTEDLAAACGWSDNDVVAGLMRVLAGLGLVLAAVPGWELTARGRALLADDVARAMYEGFSDYHTGLYDEIEQQLTGGVGRHDVRDKGDVIARLSRAMDPFVLDLLTKEVGRRTPRHLLDVGCGTGSHLAHMLQISPEASGVGIETDVAAARLARITVADAGLTGRARIVEGDARTALAAETEPFDLALLANVIYYLPLGSRVPLLKAVAERTAAGGAVVVVSTALTDVMFSRHFDLLLRTQEGSMGLPDMDELADQLRAAGLTPGSPHRIAPGEPLTAVIATRD